VEYLTDNKRKVYGGGGILPDVFVALDTSENSDFLLELLSSGLFYQFVNEYVDENRIELNGKYPDFEAFNGNFQTDEAFMNKFFALAEKELVPKEKKKAEETEKKDCCKVEEKDFETRKNEGMAVSGSIKTRLKALMGRTLLNTEAFYRVFNAEDEVVAKALESIEDKTFKRLKLSYN
jgi:carboxyl-terminal processing protease